LLHVGRRQMTCFAFEERTRRARHTKLKFTGLRLST
jgi:hypothetical protein